MHDPLEYVERLAQQARLEPTRQTHVSNAVVRRLEVPASPLRKPMMVLALGYAAAAVVALIYGWNVIHTMQEPIADVFRIAAGMVS